MESRIDSAVLLSAANGRASRAASYSATACAAFCATTCLGTAGTDAMNAAIARRRLRRRSDIGWRCGRDIRARLADPEPAVQRGPSLNQRTTDLPALSI